MKAAVYYENGDPSVLKYEDAPDPECHPKGVVIKVEAVSIEGGDTLNRFGGAKGIRDTGLLESALARAQQLYHYGTAPIMPEMAAAYAFGITSNHPCVDGNKRTAIVVAAVFLEDNGYRFEAPQVDVVLTILALAAGEIKEPTLAGWMTTHSRQMEPER